MLAFLFFTYFRAQILKTMNLKSILLTLLVFNCILLSSCKKEGCTNQFASNYDSEAKKDDGSCTYNWSQVFWWNSTTLANLQNANVNEVNIYVNNSLVANETLNFSWISAPACGANGSITTTVYLNNGALSAPYEVRDQNGNTILSGSLSPEGTNCQQLELIY